MKNIQEGYFYFIKDDFFNLVKDTNLKQNKEQTKRPHYLVFKDNKDDLYWLIPCSSRIDKYKALIEDKIKNNKPCDTIQIIKIRNKESVFLLQDMFPINKNYIVDEYIKDGQLMCIKDEKVLTEINKKAKKIKKLLLRGIKFTPTQPDVIKIKEIMLNELKQEQNLSIADKLKISDDKIKKDNLYKNKEHNKNIKL